MLNIEYEDEVYLKNALTESIEDLVEYDYHLIKTDCNERSITHCLAVHLSTRFPTYKVDCEYNRDGFCPKRLLRRMNGFNNGRETTIYPDIVVHIRGTNSSNLLVIEVKKSSSRVNHDYDIEKLIAIKHDRLYMYAVHVVVGIDDSGKLIKEQSWK